MFGVSSAAGSEAAAKGLEAVAVSRNFSIAASSSAKSFCAVLSSMADPFAAVPKAFDVVLSTLTAAATLTLCPP